MATMGCQYRYPAAASATTTRGAGSPPSCFLTEGLPLPASFLTRPPTAPAVLLVALTTAPDAALRPLTDPLAALDAPLLTAPVTLPTTGPAALPAAPAARRASLTAPPVTSTALDVAADTTLAVLLPASAMAPAVFPPARESARVALPAAPLTAARPRSSGVSKPRRREMARGPRRRRDSVSVMVGTDTVPHASMRSNHEWTTSTGRRHETSVLSPAEVCTLKPSSPRFIL
mmetsp:Transcript_10501/g.25970  ORF Transcript_10501/g.25970 Transcript_10501/m.25970 type:complete len:231 (-) Transcript_10501:181-873(-)